MSNVFLNNHLLQSKDITFPTIKVTALKFPNSHRKRLVFIRSGSQPRPLFFDTLPEKRDFDIFINYYEAPNENDVSRHHADGIFFGGLSKYQAFHQISQEYSELSNYDHVIFPDEGVEFLFHPDEIFSFCEEKSIDIAQPSLTDDSSSPFSIIRHHPTTTYRSTNFVNIAAPCFSKEFLSIALETFNTSISGWGLDVYWGYLLGGKYKAAIIDNFRMRHGFQEYSEKTFADYFSLIGVNPKIELRGIFLGIGIERYEIKVHQLFFKSESISISNQNQIEPSISNHKQKIKRLSPHSVGQEFFCQETHSDAKKNQYILYIDHKTPRPDEDSGSIDAYNHMKSLREIGFGVFFYPWARPIHEGSYTDALEEIGVNCLHSPEIGSFSQWMLKHGQKFSAIIITRAGIACECLAQVKAYAPDAKIIFNTVDLHFLREQRQAEIQGNDSLMAKANKKKEIETKIISLTDATIVVSPFEKGLLSELVPNTKIYNIPIFRDIPGRSTSYSDRKDIIFIGGFEHTPNIDAMNYFINTVWPLVRKEVPDMKFHIVGSKMPPQLANIAHLNIVGHGYVKDLGDVFDTVRVSVAPLRYGAGQKGKVVTSLSYGVPVVATTIAAEGMNTSKDDVICIGDTPESFSREIIGLYNDQEKWNRFSEAGIAHATSIFGYEAGKKSMEEMISQVLSRR